MNRLKVIGFANVSFCMHCVPTRFQVEVEGKTAIIKDDVVFEGKTAIIKDDVVFVVKEKRYVGECYPYVMLDGKKYRFELVEVEDE